MSAEASAKPHISLALPLVAFGAKIYIFTGGKGVALILSLCYLELGKSVFYGSQAAVLRGDLRTIPLLITYLINRGQCGSIP